MPEKGRKCLYASSLFYQTNFGKHTWIALELTLDEIIWEWTQLLHPTNCNILSTILFALFIKLIVNLHARVSNV